MKLKEYAPFTATLKLKSGLHIGSGEKGHYGEPLSVIKSLSSQLPYIPGSTVKGKVRSLLETMYGKATDGKPCECGTCQICLLFGSGKAETTHEPSRLIFRDSYLTQGSQSLIEKVDLEKKAGVRIDRQTGKSADKALYALERVPEGTEFKVEISARIFDNDNKEAVKKWLAMGLFLVEQDAIGGSGTRGSGQIEFNNIIFDGVTFEQNWRETCKKEKNTLINTQIKKSEL